MLYYKNKKRLQYIKLRWVVPSMAFIFLSIILHVCYTFVSIVGEKITEQKVIVVLNQRNAFSVEKFEKKLKEMNFQFPYIIYAQAILETDSFRSNIFKENNNLFGMKQALIRIHVSKGIQYDHACYDTWIDSLIDYALYYSTYLSQLKTEDDYFNYLSQFYAEDKEYVNKLKAIINKYNLKNK